MLKFFREYNKYILAVGVALLMIAFLIQPTLSMFTPDPREEVIGTIGGEEVTLGDQRVADTHLRVLESVSPILLAFAGNTPGEPPHPLQWFLMLRDAQSMGLSASDAQVNELLVALNFDEARLASVSRQMGMSRQAVREALRQWIVVLEYKELVNGLAHTRFDERLRYALTAMQLMQRGNYMIGLGLSESAFGGAPRLREPLLKRFMYDEQTRVRITALVVPSDRYVLGVSEPDEQTQNELFERYKESLPGEGEPYGLGYRVPDRVKIEYLEIPMSRLREKVRVEEADALAYGEAPDAGTGDEDAETA